VVELGEGMEQEGQFVERLMGFVVVHGSSLMHVCCSDSGLTILGGAGSSCSSSFSWAILAAGFSNSGALSSTKSSEMVGS